MNKYEYIVWDWNGTILNDVNICVDVINALLKRRRMKEISINEYKNSFCFPVINYYKKLGFDFKKESFDSIAVEYMNEYTKRFNECKLYSNVIKVLKKNNSDNIMQILLSVTEKNRLLEQVKKYEINNIFTDILGTSSINGIGKADIAIEWLNSNKIDNTKVLFIGDTLHDYEIAQMVGCDCLLVAQGHQSKDILNSSNAVVIDNILNLLNYTRFVSKQENTV